MEHTPTNEPIEGVVSLEGYTQSAGTGFKESLLLTVNPEAEFVDPDEDLDSVFARRGGAFEEAQTWRPVIVRIHPDAGRETVLRLLDKMRAKVERDWEVIVSAHDPEAQSITEVQTVEVRFRGEKLSTITFEDGT